MKKTILKNCILSSLTLFSISLALPLASAGAASAKDNISSSKAKTAQDKETIKAHLAAAKLKACQNRLSDINNIMLHSSERGQKQIDQFSKLADRAESTYTTKAKKLDNYSALVAEVTTKKSAAQASVNATKASASTFKCEGTEPKITPSDYQSYIKKQNGALNAYKKAVERLTSKVSSAPSTKKTSEKQ